MNSEALKQADRFDAADIARAALLSDSETATQVGELIKIETVEEHIDAYYFESLHPGYIGWNWLVTISKLEDYAPTICDTVLLPTESALMAPAWIPYQDRLQPGDLKPGDIIPTSPDDVRLVPASNVLPEDEELDLIELFEFGASKARVLSVTGKDLASKRWHEGEQGPKALIAQSSSKPCGSCGFYIPLSGSLKKAFGVCANLLAPDDGKVVSVDHGCGAHSEVLVR